MLNSTPKSISDILGSAVLAVMAVRNFAEAPALFASYA
jgi:hypothetical protein